ncbi:hypothetical protein T03_10154 [Trichinella britovi]|uniref:Uncharacterized protein n=1 Tax=Trichinella britovi TaxID=45882 RepID=A0A0V1CRV0_TRIBR|nr:hypothetical protein T03_10154 [Trichinella britovi]
MVILQTFNKPGGARRISTPMHTALLRSPHTDFTLPPVALQKGKRDAQVQFRGRRHTGLQNYGSIRQSCLRLNRSNTSRLMKKSSDSKEKISWNSTSQRKQKMGHQGERADNSVRVPSTSAPLQTTTCSSSDSTLVQWWWTYLPLTFPHILYVKPRRFGGRVVSTAVENGTEEYFLDNPRRSSEQFTLDVAEALTKVNKAYPKKSHRCMSQTVNVETSRRRVRRPESSTAARLDQVAQWPEIINQKNRCRGCEKHQECDASNATSIFV